MFFQKETQIKLKGTVNADRPLVVSSSYLNETMLLPFIIDLGGEAGVCPAVTHKAAGSITGVTKVYHDL